jgi:hypothetical protein
MVMGTLYARRPHQDIRAADESRIVTLGFSGLSARRRSGAFALATGLNYVPAGANSAAPHEWSAQSGTNVVVFARMWQSAEDVIDGCVIRTRIGDPFEPSGTTPR